MKEAKIMRKITKHCAAGIFAGVIAFTAFPKGTQAITINKELTMKELLIPVAVNMNDVAIPIEAGIQTDASSNIPIIPAVEQKAAMNILVADVDNYVNIRETASTEGKILGKLYDGCVGMVLSEQDGWSQIKSGTVTGYVASEYCITGEAAQAIYDDVINTVAVVKDGIDGLNVRSEANTSASVLKVLYSGNEAVVLAQQEGWVKVVCGTKEGYVSSDYVTVELKYDMAESLEEEKARLAAEAAAKKKKQEAEAAKKESSSQTSDGQAPQAGVSTSFTEGMTSYDKGVVVAEFAAQFEGNPYVWGGTSLTNGADCSGFVLAVYKEFGVKLPHSANADQKQGYAVDGIDNAQPGDLICYSGHVGLYIGNGQIIHASTQKTGIKISNANYKTILAVRRIF